MYRIKLKPVRESSLNISVLSFVTLEAQYIVL
jgi:hypothetical protein